MKVGVIGAGSWGTALARLLALGGHDVTLWFRTPGLQEAAEHAGENRRYLPGFAFPPGMRTTSEIAPAVTGCDALIAACPSHAMREVFLAAAAHISGRPLIVSASKGIEARSLRRMTEVLVDVCGARHRPRTGVLSGPSFATEVAAAMPTAVTVAAPDPDVALEMQTLLATPAFRVYRSTDVVGVELSGAAKNVIAIAAGISDGMGFGHSTRAALVTRGVTETSRLVARAGGDPRTSSGLSGVGDLVLTCTGELSRNRRVGLRLGQGETLAQILADMKMVAEGVRNTATVCQLARSLEVELPICEQVDLLLHAGKSVAQVVHDLQARGHKSEFWGLE